MGSRQMHAHTGVNVVTLALLMTSTMGLCPSLPWLLVHLFTATSVFAERWACNICDPESSGERGKRFLRSAQRYTLRLLARKRSASRAVLKKAK